MGLKLLFLCKRRPMGRDLVTRPFGRFFYLPYHLAERGHDITLLLLDYRQGKPVDMRVHGIRWISEPVTLGYPGRYLDRLRQLLRADRPDWVVGLSDTYFGILAQHYGRKYGILSCIDAYDNYESYIPWLKPLHGLWRRALSRADLVTAAGPGLLQYMSRQRHGRPSLVVPMAADPIGFRPMDQGECRLRMGLPSGRKLVGYCGSTHKNRGLHVLFGAIAMLQEKQPDVSLLISGRTWKNVAIPESVYQLGYVVDEDMPTLLNCMDILTVLNRVTSFGNFSYPVKLFEAMSCGVPVIATATPATRWILRDHPDCLVQPSDPGALCRKIEHFLGKGQICYNDLPDWQSSAGLLEKVFLGRNMT
jgi:glycosyltransferase involved in cell wall biosynthesis